MGIGITNNWITESFRKLTIFFSSQLYVQLLLITLHNHKLFKGKWQSRSWLKKRKRKLFSSPPGFEPWSPGTESHCATVDSLTDLGMSVQNCKIMWPRTSRLRQICKTTRWFAGSDALKLLEYLKVLEPFSSGTYLLPMVGRCSVPIPRKLNNSWMAAESSNLLSVDKIKHK